MCSIKLFIKFCNHFERYSVDYKILFTYASENIQGTHIILHDINIASQMCNNLKTIKIPKLSIKNGARN